MKSSPGITTVIRFTLNGREQQVEITGDMTALRLLRDRLKLKGTKEGCGIGECGACTIVVDGLAVNACLMHAAQLDGRRVETIEGLGREGELHPIQEAFVKHHAVQCGFCTPGMIMSTKALLDENPNPDETAVRTALSGNLCRCTGYQHIFASVAAAVRSQRGEESSS
ncbi:MAG: (2Fe-2S)-binding protein [Desulfobacterales bacterium]